MDFANLSYVYGWTKATKPNPQISRSIHNSGSCQARVLRQAVAAAAIVVVGRHKQLIVLRMHQHERAAPSVTYVALGTCNRIL